MLRILTWVMALVVVASSIIRADQAALELAETRLKAIYERGEYDHVRFRGKWLPDSTGYVVVERPQGSDTQELVRYDVATGMRSVLLGKRHWETALPMGRFEIREVLMGADSDRFLLEGLQVTKRQQQKAFWLFDAQAQTLRKIAADIAWVPGEHTLSPITRQMIYSQHANLHILDLETQQAIAVTSDGEVGTIENGVEVRWSPDGKQVAYVQADKREIPRRPTVLPTDPTYPQVVMKHYARVGAPIPTLRIGVVGHRGGETRWLDLPRPAGTFYVQTVEWAGNSHELMVELQSRGRDARELLLIHVKTGETTTLYEESDEAWVDASSGRNAGLIWTQDGKSAVVLSEKDGWRHAYLVSRDGDQQALLTSEPYDIIERGTVDESGSWFYFYASPDNATQRYLYRVKTGGNEKPSRVSPATQAGTHRYVFSPNGKWAIHSFSNFDTPPVVSLVELADHRTLRMLESNKRCQKRTQTLVHPTTEFLKLDIGNDIVLDAWMLKPRDFDPAKKYPVFVYVYSEPHAQTVLDEWSVQRNHTMFHRMITDLGYLVISIDSRGTPAPKGAAWRRAVYGSLGPLSTEEQAAGLIELGRMRSYVDTSRVGIWGWSGGGTNTLNAMFRKSHLYQVGIAVAPKPQPQLYNAWFQEIFMRTPQENPDGYRRAAAINFAEGLQGKLLIIHGTGETNTHLQITEGLVDKLIGLGKRFDYMAYPNRDHGIWRGKGTRVHLRMLITRYLLEHLPRGPR